MRERERERRKCYLSKVYELKSLCSNLLFFIKISIRNKTRKNYIIKFKN